MTGAGRKKEKAARHQGQQSSKTTTTPPNESAAYNNQGDYNGNEAGLDGPRTPEHGFGPSLGYDPARTAAPSSQALVMNNRLELPPDAYPVDVPTNLPLRPSFNTKGKEVQIRVNQFKVTQWPQKKVYQFDITIGNGVEKRGLIRAVWNSKTLQKKLTSLDPIWLFDGNKIAWCSTKPPTEEVRILIDLDAERNREPRMNNGVPVENKIYVRVKFATEINMAVITGYLTQQMGWNSHILAAINFLDHCIRQWPSEKFVLIKRSFFGRGSEGRVKLDDVIEGLKGVYSSIRLCPTIGAPGKGTGLALNVDVANGTFWISQPLHQSVRNFLKSSNPNLQWPKLRDSLMPTFDTENKAWQMSKDFKELRKYTKLRFTVIHRGKQNETKVYTIKKFVFDQKLGQFGGHSKNVKFNGRDPANPEAPPKEMTVYDYFDKKYNYMINHWYLPLVQTEKDGWFPMEVCVLESNQRFQYKLSPEQTAAMIKFAVTKPSRRIEDIHHGMNLLSHNEDPYLKHYGIKIDTNMTATSARLLPNPDIQFLGSKVNPHNTGRWDLRGKKFVRPNTAELESWGVGIVKNCIDQDTVKNFMRVFIQQYQGHGGRIKNKQPVIYSSPAKDSIADCVTITRQKAKQQANGMEPQILLYILPDKNSFEYERAKKSNEVRYGTFSQMMLVAHIKKAQPQYCSNVCMKLNAKLGGTTSWIAAPTGTSSKDFFNRTPTMIIGVDVSHASPGSQQPSMAAVTMSMDREAARYAAAVQTNGNRVEILTTMNIRSMLTELFNHWVQNVGGGRGPTNIYYFRDGVSEGQYAHVLTQEVCDMKALFKELYPPGDPKFTVTVCSKRHHLRFFPKNGDSSAGDRNGNPHPGTLVERDITHPFENDFYLSSHSAIQGTARPVHYHVILDEIKVQPNNFHAMIYEHCYQYMRSTTPVSLYPAVYYAHLASNRARAHEKVPASQGPRSGKQFVEAQQDKAIAAAMGKIQPPSTSQPSDTEALPLMKLGGELTGPLLARLVNGMWYI